MVAHDFGPAFQAGISFNAQIGLSSLPCGRRLFHERVCASKLNMRATASCYYFGGILAWH